MKFDANVAFLCLPIAVAVGALFVLVEREGTGLPWAIALSVLLLFATLIFWKKS